MNNDLIKLLTLLDGLIQETEFVINPSLFMLLKKLNDPVAELLISLNNNEIEFNLSYINTSDTEGLMSFLPDNRINDNDVMSNWKNEKRMEIKAGKLIKSLVTSLNMNNEITDKMIEEFVNKYKTNQKDFYFKIVKGHEITKWYSERYYHKEAGLNHDKGSLYSSCMRYDHCQDFFNVYSKSNNVSMLCMFNSKSHLLMGRALVWDLRLYLESTTNFSRITYMDRIYCLSQDLERVFKQYALEQDWWFRVKQGAENMQFMTNDRLIHKEHNEFVFVAELGNLMFEHEQKPFMDTLFKFGYLKTKSGVVPVSLYSSYMRRTNFKEMWGEQDGGFDLNPHFEKDKDIFYNELN